MLAAVKSILSIQIICASSICLSAFLVCATPTAEGASISFGGAFEVAGGNESFQTLDWHFFRLTGQSPSISIHALVEAGNANTAWMIVGAYDGSEFLSEVSFVDPECGEATCFGYEGTFSPGVWAIGFMPQTTARDPSYIGDPTWPEFQFNWGRYFLTVDSLTGVEELDWVEHREGNLNGTFTITRIPEPSTAILLLTGLLAGVGRRRKDQGWRIG